MDANYFHEFVVLADLCSYQEAANQLFISLSSLSKHISRIEEEMGVTLLSRSARSVTLTECGKLFYKYALQISRLYDNCSRSLNSVNEENEKKISVSFLPVLGQYGILERISGFKKSHPDVKLTLSEANSPKRCLLDQTSDFAFDAVYGYIDETPNNFNRLLIDVDSLAVAFPTGHPLADTDSVTIEQLRDEKFVLQQKTSTILTDYLMKLCADAGFQPKVAATVSFTSTVTKLVGQGAGIALVNRRHVPYGEMLDLKLVDIVPRHTFNIYLYYSNNRKLTYGAKAFLHYIQDTII